MHSKSQHVCHMCSPPAGCLCWVRARPRSPIVRPMLAPDSLLWRCISTLATPPALRRSWLAIDTLLASAHLWGARSQSTRRSLTRFASKLQHYGQVPGYGCIIIHPHHPSMRPACVPACELSMLGLRLAQESTCLLLSRWGGMRVPGPATSMGW